MEIGTVIWVLASIILLVGISALMRRSREKVIGVDKNVFGFIALVLGGLLVAGQLGYINLGIEGAVPQSIKDTIKPLATQGTPTAGSSTLCAVEDTTVTLSALNKFLQTSAGGTHRYRINTNAPLTVADAGTFTASPGDSVQVLWENESRSGSYFSDISSFTVPCKGTYTQTVEVYQNGTLTFDVFNQEGNLIDGNAENETLAAGDTVTLSTKLTGQYQRGFPYGGVIIAEYNTSEVDDVIVNLGGVKTNVPDFFTVSNTINTAKAYTVPAILSNKELVGSVYIDADDTNNPGTGSDVVLRFYPTNPFINEDNGGAFEGAAVEDEDDARTYGHSTASTVHLD